MAHTQESASQWALSDVSWPNNLIQLSYCLIVNPRHPIMRELIDAAFDAWGQYLPAVGFSAGLAARGLNFTFSGACRNPAASMSADDNLLTISLEKPEMASTGVTSRRFRDGTTEDPFVSMRGADLQLDVRLMPSAGLFYNTLLHEAGHLLGCDHPARAPNKASDAVMSSSVTLVGQKVLQENTYNYLRPGDLACVRELYLRDFPGIRIPNQASVVPMIPNYPASRHVSGVWDAAVPQSVDLSVADVSVLPPTRRPTAAYITPTPRPTQGLWHPRPPAKNAPPRPPPRPRYAPARQNIVSNFSSDVRVDAGNGTSSTIGVRNDIVPDVFIDPSVNANVSVDARVDAAIELTGVNDNSSAPLQGVDVTLVTQQTPEIVIQGSARPGADAQVNVATSITPNIMIEEKAPPESPPAWWKGYSHDYGPQYGEPAPEQPATTTTVSVAAHASPAVHITGSHARVSIESNIVPSITISSHREQRHRHIGDPIDEGESEDP
jgi:hypothetical protein